MIFVFMIFGWGMGSYIRILVHNVDFGRSDSSLDSFLRFDEGDWDWCVF